MTVPVTPHELGLLRLVAQGLVGVPPGTAPQDVVHRLLAVQAQDLRGALTSVALRTEDRSRDAVVAALDAGHLVRTWPVRGTLHLVAAGDVGWLLRTTAVRDLGRSAARRAELGLDPATLDRAAEVADAALAAVSGRVEAPGLLRAELLAAWQEAGVSTDGQRGYHLVAHLAQTGLLCLGPVRGSEQLLVRVVDRVGPGLPVAGEQALAELARRYLTGHGPATVADLARWSGTTLGQARTGLALVRDELAVLPVAGAEHWLDPTVPDRLAACRSEAEQVLLLPGFDEYLLGYRDRSAVLAPEHADRVVPGRNGVFRPTVVDAGQVVGTWRPAATGRTVDGLQVEPFTALRPGVRAAAVREHARLPWAGAPAARPRR